VTDEFTAPHRGDLYAPKDHAGELHLFFPTEWHASVPTKFSEPGKPDPAAVTTHIAFLDGPSAGVVLSDAMVFGGFMVPQLKKGVPGQGEGKAVLGRLGQGQAKKGDPPWVILDPTEGDITLARQWFAANQDPRNKFEAPAPPTSVASVPTATVGGNTPTVAGVSAASAPAPSNGASSANPADLIKLAQNNIPTAGLDAAQIQLIAATL
jgi:hypothetical protein